jgi:hypothetical protein
MRKIGLMIGRWKTAVLRCATIGALVMVSGTAVSAAEINVIASNPLRAAYLELVPQC